METKQHAVVDHRISMAKEIKIQKQTGEDYRYRVLSILTTIFRWLTYCCILAILINKLATRGQL